LTNPNSYADVVREAHAFDVELVQVERLGDRAIAVVERVVGAVGEDLCNGTWDVRHGHLRRLDAYDAGMRLLISHRR